MIPKQGHLALLRDASLAGSAAHPYYDSTAGRKSGVPHQEIEINFRGPRAIIG